MLKRESVRKATGSYRTYSMSGKIAAFFLSLRWKTYLRHNCSLDSCACCEGPWAEHSDDDDDYDDDDDDDEVPFIRTVRAAFNFPK